MEYTNTFPQFIGIGATKSATSWLYEQLNHHPDIWLPPAKELHYFSRSTKYPSRTILACSRPIWLRFLGLNRADKSFKFQLWRTLVQTLRNPSMSKIRWHLKYFFGRHDDAWYASLFEEAKGRLRGEITPAYSMLDDEDVRIVKTLIPDAKIIFLLRNPIDRTWSSIRYDHKDRLQKKSMPTLSRQDWEMLASNDGIGLRSNYLRTLSIWKNYFSEEQFFVGYYDEIQENPEKLLLRLFSFLGVESDRKYIADNVAQPLNVSIEKEIPKELKLYLAQKYYSEIQEMSNLLGSYATKWLKDLEPELEG